MMNDDEIPLNEIAKECSDAVIMLIESNPKGIQWLSRKKRKELKEECTKLYKTICSGYDLTEDEYKQVVKQMSINILERAKDKIKLKA